MCRLFGQLTLRSAPAVDLLVGSERSLLRQSDFDRSNLQKDGWGLGYYEGASAKVVKSPGAAFEESPRFRAAASRIRSKAVIGHIRAASNPSGLSRRSLISLANTQPFTDGRILFAHNGTLWIPGEVAQFLGSYRRRLRGKNDSEVFFWQFMKFLDAYASIPRALEACVHETWRIWEGCKKRYKRRSAPYTGLNAVVTDGASLHGLCHYPYGRDGACAVFGGCRWGTMSVAVRGDRAVVASESLDGGSWERLKDPEIVSVSANGRIRLSRRRFSL